jgi:glycine/D-amino acid oxidase-like deaminating enzyme
VAISYFTDPGIQEDNSYFYLTRRPYEYEKGVQHNLISIGGPDVSIEDTTPYSRDDEYPEEHADNIDRFVKETYDTEPNKKIDYVFTWHGLMGYTKNGVRLVGPEPKNPVLLYNLGCNGIGILTSLHGASKIARHINGEQVGRSIFDVPVTLPKRRQSSPSGIASLLARLGF